MRWINPERVQRPFTIPGPISSSEESCGTRGEGEEEEEKDEDDSDVREEDDTSREWCRPPAVEAVEAVGAALAEAAAALAVACNATAAAVREDDADESIVCF